MVLCYRKRARPVVLRIKRRSETSSLRTAAQTAESHTGAPDRRRLNSMVTGGNGSDRKSLRDLYPGLGAKVGKRSADHTVVRREESAATPLV
ncbi:unnamed protein product [Lota lota]